MLIWQGSEPTIAKAIKSDPDFGLLVTAEANPLLIMSAEVLHHLYWPRGYHGKSANKALYLLPLVTPLQATGE